MGSVAIYFTFGMTNSERGPFLKKVRCNMAEKNVLPLLLKVRYTVMHTIKITIKKNIMNLEIECLEKSAILDYQQRQISLLLYLN